MLNSSLLVWAQNENKSEDVGKVKKEDHLYYPNVQKKTAQSFVYFFLSPAILEKNIYKLHLSVSPKDYGRVLYESDLNKRLQEGLSPMTLTSLKYVDPVKLKNFKDIVKLAHQYLTKFYPCIARHNALDSTQTAEKEKLYQWIISMHDWFTKSWGNTFTPLKALLDSDLVQLKQYHKDGFALWKEVSDSALRLDQEVQYTLYFPRDVNAEALAKLIKNTTDYLIEIGINPVPCPESDLPLTAFVSFRQDKFELKGEYVHAGTRESLKLKELAQSAELYQQLLQILEAPVKQEEQLGLEELTTLHL